MLTYTNPKNYLLLSVVSVMVQGCVAYVDPYSESVVHTGYQNGFETRPPFYGFDVFYDYYDRPYYVDSSRRVIYIDTQYYPYIKSHYQYQKTEYGRTVEYHDDNRRDTYPHDQLRVIDRRHDDDNRGRGNPNDISHSDHVDNYSNKNNDTGSHNFGRPNHNTENGNNHHSNPWGRTY